MKSKPQKMVSHDGKTKISFPKFIPIQDELKEFAKQVETPAICDVSVNPRSMDPGIMSMCPGVKMIGNALTVAVSPGDNLIIHMAIRLIRPGLILVISTGDPPHPTGCYGDLMATSTKVMGGEGAIVDGYIRDPRDLEEDAFPVFARGACPVPTTKVGGGEINGIVTCGGVIVKPGDVIMADDSGIVVIENEESIEIFRAAVEKTKGEALRKKAILDGSVSPRFLEGKIRDIGLQKLLETEEWNRLSEVSKNE